MLTPSTDCTAVNCSVFLNRATRDPSIAARVVVRLRGKDVAQIVTRPERVVRIDVPDAELWSPDQPTLYDVAVTLERIASPLPDDNDRQGLAQLHRQVPLRGETEQALYRNSDVGDALDRVDSYFGMRTIQVGPHPAEGHPTLLLNGEPVFHLGTLDQGWWPDGLHTPPADEALVYEIEFLKAAGFNTVRKHIKVEPQRYYYHCDRLGMLVWQDMPSGFLPAQFVAPNDEAEGKRSNRSASQFEQELRRMITGVAHHPCVVMWVLHNEGWGQYDTARLTSLIRGLDDKRLVNATSGWLDVGAGDVVDWHDYSASPSVESGDGVRAVVMGEYGGIGWPIEEHLWDPNMRNWGYQTFFSSDDARAAYLKVTDSISRAQQQHGLCAAIYTQTSDVEGEVNGLLTYDRAVSKFPSDWLSEAHQQLF